MQTRDFLYDIQCTSPIYEICLNHISKILGVIQNYNINAFIYLFYVRTSSANVLVMSLEQQHGALR